MRLLYTLLFICCTASCVFAQSFGPVASCTDAVNVALPSNGCEATITADMIDGGSYHANNWPMSRSVSPQRLGPGTHTVTLYLFDGHRSATCWSSVTVEDKTAPVARCRPATLRADHPQNDSGLSATDVDDGSSDNCAWSGDIFTLPGQTLYWGPKWYKYIVSDPAYNTDQCHARVSILSPNMPAGWGPCFPSGNSTYEYIRRVELRSFGPDIDHFGPAGGTWYSGYHEILPQNNMQLTLTPAYPGASYPEYWKVLYDQNVDGDFDDPGEVLYSGRGTGVQTAAINMSRLADDLPISKLRVIMSYYPITNNCPTGFWGSHMDITVQMADPTGALATRELRPVDGTDLSTETMSEARPEPFTSREVSEELRRRQAGVVTTTASFPNPARGGRPVTVTTRAASIELYALTGRRVGVWATSAGAVTTKITLPQELAAGVYLLRAGNRTERLVVR